MHEQCGADGRDDGEAKSSEEKPRRQTARFPRIRQNGFGERSRRSLRAPLQSLSLRRLQRIADDAHGLGPTEPDGVDLLCDDGRLRSTAVVEDFLDFGAAVLSRREVASSDPDGRLAQSDDIAVSWSDSVLSSATAEGRSGVRPWHAAVVSASSRRAWARRTMAPA